MEHFTLKNNVAVYGGFSGTENASTFNPDDRNFADNETILSGLHPGEGAIIPPYRVYHVFYHPNSTGLDQTAILDGCTITLGQADGDDFPYNRGGGMLNVNSDPTIRKCRFTQNHAVEMGGALYNEESSPLITACTFDNNTSGNDGAGIRNAYSQAEIVNCTFSQNNSTNYGGGICNSYSEIEIINCTFFQNNAGVLGGALSNSYLSPTIKNSLLYDNGAGNVYDEKGAACNITWSLVQGGWPGQGNIDSDPLLQPLADNGGPTLTCAIPVNSPAYGITKNAGGGNWNGAPATDQRGISRTNGGMRAMGAYEKKRGALPGVYLLLLGE